MGKWIVAIFIIIMLMVGIMRYLDYTADKKCNDYCYERYPYKRSILPNGQGAILQKSFQDTIAIAGIKRTIDEAYLDCYVACREGLIVLPK